MAENGAASRVLQIVGAAGGALLVLYLFGGLVMWVRLDQVGAPADQTVAALPRELLLVVGLRTLVLPIVVLSGLGALGTTLAWTYNRRLVKQEKPAKKRLAPGVGVLTPYLCAAVVGYLIFLVAALPGSPGKERFAHVWIALVAASAVVVSSGVYGTWLNSHFRWRSERRPEWALRGVLVYTLPIAAVSAMVLALAYEAARAPAYPPAKIVRNGSGGHVDGFFIAESSGVVVLGAGLCDSRSHHFERIVVVPRSDVAAVVVGKSIRLNDSQGRRSQWRSLHVCGGA